MLYIFSPRALHFSSIESRKSHIFFPVTASICEQEKDDWITKKIYLL